MDIAKDIYAFWAKQNEQPPRRHLGASGIGRECERAVWYDFHHVKKSNFPGRIQRLFQAGHAFEPRLIEELRAIGLHVHSEDEHGNQFRLGAAGGLCGSCDGFVAIDDKWGVLEAKTHNDKSFKDLEKKGVKESKPQHYAQMQVYMGYSQMDFALYASENKNTSELYFEIIEFKHIEFEKMQARANRIIHGKTIPERVSDNPTAFVCKFCDAFEVCHSKKVPEINCRTCVNWSMAKDGSGYCGVYGPITDKTEATGCDDHVFNPELMPYEPVGGDTDWILYSNRLANVSRGSFPAIDDGTPPIIMTSSEIASCGTFRAVEKAMVIKDTFGGEVANEED